MKLALLLLTGISAAVLSASAWAQKPSTPPYKDASKPIEKRVSDLLGRMTLDEKVAQLQSMWTLPGSLSDLAGAGIQSTSLFDNGKFDEARARQNAINGLGTYVFLNEFMGMSGGPKEGVELRNQLQEWNMKNTRLGIPIMFHGEALHGAVRKDATSFPQAIALGSTWDPDLLEKMFGVVAMETRASGNALVLAPVLDLSRDPRYGRVEEMYSEDPFLTARMGVAAIRGLQGTSSTFDENHVIATAKHFVHGQPENGSNVGPNDFSERTMREVFLYPFEQAIKQGHIGAVMPSYNENNGGIPSSANPWLLQKVLRQEWGFSGITVSDYMAVEQLATLQHVVPDIASAGELALKTGVDMELPSRAGYAKLADAVKSGRVSQKALDGAVARVLTMKFRAGLFEHPYTDAEKVDSIVGTKEHGDLARKVADESIVLLKNDKNLLPLDSAQIKTIAVIGPNASKIRQGTYSGVPPYYVTALDGIRHRVEPGAKVVFAEGCLISDPDQSPQMNSMMPYTAPKQEKDARLIEEAVEVAKNADVVVLALGGNEIISRESIGQTTPGAPPSYGDSDTLELPGRQNELVDRIAGLGKPTVAVLLNGRPYAITELVKRVPAIVEGWYLGQETGNAIAGVLFGDINPSGHLPVTIARNVGQLPVFYYKTPAARRGYVFNENTPLFPFGFGMSYTTFEIGKPAVDREQITPAGKAQVSVTVTNTGKRSGDQVVQMYIHHPVSSVVQPVIALKGFQRVHLEPGASQKVTFEVGPDELSILDSTMQRIVEPGKVDVLIGMNSAETTAVQLTVAQ
jgi:Beta-glucosidase-related glycosidases